MRLIDAAPLKIRQTFRLILLLLGIVSSGLAQTWIPTSAPNWWWYSIASSADGSNVVASGGNLVYFSTNSGVTWTPINAPNGWCWNLASSADGRKVYAIGSGSFGGSSSIWAWTRESGGWIQTGSGMTNWQSIACSGDGLKLVAAYGRGWAAPPGYIYTSQDAGSNWLPTPAPAAPWGCVASSAAATVLAAAPDSGPIYISTNSGGSWFPTVTPSLHWTSLACSANGATIAGIGFYPITICSSTNFGASWTVFTDPGFYSQLECVASSADGKRLVAIAASNQRGGSSTAYFSTNSGADWQASICPGNTNLCSVASSADGDKVFAAMAISGIFTAQTTPVPGLKLARADGGLTLSWVVPSATFSLQKLSDLSSFQWADLDLVATLNCTNLENEVSVPVESGGTFFRLISR